MPVAAASAAASADEKLIDDCMAALEELVHHLQDRVDKLEDFITTQHESILKQRDQLRELKDFVTIQHEMILKQSNLLDLAKMPPPLTRQASEGSIPPGESTNPEEHHLSSEKAQDGVADETVLATAMALAIQPGVVLIPPTPQTSQEATAYAAVPLVSVPMEVSLKGMPEAGEDATQVGHNANANAAHVVDNHVEVQFVPVYSQDEGVHTQATGDNGETALAKEVPVAAPMANVIGMPPPPRSSSPTHCRHSMV